ncbi:MAG TPA: hypothetical protein VHD32_10200 [Candidatus Didemnitutus sp.]|nr:hypothetical protein [Candidatus Didemnitutus sp.]
MPPSPPLPGKLLPTREYAHRLARSFLCGLVLIAISLLIGIVGYHFIGELAWIDAFVDAAMILSGMGPVSPLHSNSAKLFAGFYALYCGIALLSTAGIMFAPMVHRSLHRFHIESGRDR